MTEDEQNLITFHREATNAGTVVWRMGEAIKKLDNIHKGVGETLKLLKETADAQAKIAGYLNTDQIGPAVSLTVQVRGPDQNPQFNVYDAKFAREAIEGHNTRLMQRIASMLEKISRYERYESMMREVADEIEKDIAQQEATKSS